MRLIRRSRLVVRTPTVDDARGIAHVLVESWREAYGDLLPAELLAGMSVAERHKQLEVALAAPAPAGAVRLVAEQQGVIIGFANAGVTSPVGEDATEPSIAELAVLYVAPEHWSQGVGRKLLSRVIRKLGVDECTEVRAWVVDGNERAFTFFERQGWSRMDQHRREVMDGHLVRQTRITRSLED